MAPGLGDPSPPFCALRTRANRRQPLRVYAARRSASERNAPALLTRILRVTNAPTDLVHLRALFDCLPTAVLLANDAAVYVDANRTACQLLERTREQVLGLHLSEIVAPGRRREVDLQWQAFLRDGVQSGVFHLDLPSGRRVVHFHAQANFVKGLHCSFLTPQPMPREGTGEPAQFVTVCAWTKQILEQGRWVPLEQFLQDRLGRPVTHGMCPAVFDRMVGEIEGDRGR